MFQSRLFQGRISRLPYFLSVMGLWLVLLLAQPLLLGLNSFIDSGRVLDWLWDGDYQAYGAAVDAAIDQTTNQSARYVALSVVTLSLIAAFFVLSARRLRDLGRPGRYALIAFVPFVGFQALFAVLILLPGDTGANAYGPRRKRDVEDETAHGFHPQQA